ncbi:hypothetical protein [Stutzerimonas stutzeri]|uniref:hypothetical protein n=1 Tax=Stutzerimonas stutzeri TaxID=316 RepID=UPI001BCC214A|nr:hypothetical protein [Stutzerimonas stutzeri]
MTSPSALLPGTTGYTKTKPATAGAYYVRCFRRGEPDSRPALVEVVLAGDGLVCNLNELNTDDEPAGWCEVEKLSTEFEWLGPLVLQSANQRAELARRDGLYYGLLPDNLESHQSTWLQALARLIDLEAPGVIGGPNDRSFWEHELRAMQDMYADLQRLKALDGEAS